MSAWWRDNQRPLSPIETRVVEVLGFLFVTVILAATLLPVALWLRGAP